MAKDGAATEVPTTWQRRQRRAPLTLAVPSADAGTKPEPVPDSGGLQVVLNVRDLPADAFAAAGMPSGTRAVSVFLVNRRPALDGAHRDTALAFQVRLELRLAAGFVPRPNTRGSAGNDADERVANLQFRDAFEYAVGHNVASQAQLDSDGVCREVATCWLPQAEVPLVAPSSISGVTLVMESLAELVDGAAAAQQLAELPRAYRAWIQRQHDASPALTPEQAEASQMLLQDAQAAAARIEAGIALLADPQVLDAFRTANRAMARAARQRSASAAGVAPEAVRPPAWRPFQLAFLLLNLTGLAQGAHPDRGVVDLLFFPTGGGKTEAYLGLAAFTLVLRRLRHPGLGSAGLAVLMRYTLRLLTLDQLSRAAALICALELERADDPGRLGPWPFEIGLWVGRGATPNRMGHKGDGNDASARAVTIAYQKNSAKAPPIPVENCPWCGTAFTPASFQLLPNADTPTDLRVGCVNGRCEFSGNRPLPILAVDEPIYRRLPAFVIATVDKFAALPWTAQVGAFFGHVDRADGQGFYGPADPPGYGRALDGPLPPPDLIIQDELHLISGPMGTMVGLYETALDALCRRTVDGVDVRPKIIASTATVRRAEVQIKALFDRPTVRVFPPPGPDRRDSYFAHMVPLTEQPGRLYLGVAAQGRSLKMVLRRVYLALLAAAERAWQEGGGAADPANAADAYMTLVGYFNSLRELGGARRIVEDEVYSGLAGHAARRREDEAAGLFAERSINPDVMELTSRLPTHAVAEAKRRLALEFAQPEHVDVALATNMISVGLDIPRLGLMVVTGQPKTTSEYIQATSRVGRREDRPGLVVTLMNVHKPRDRSHYERFGAYHDSFYRSVEATSVTPFSDCALDRGLAGMLVGLARHSDPRFTPPRGAAAILTLRGELNRLADQLALRAENTASSALLPAERAAVGNAVRQQTQRLLDAWERIAHEEDAHGAVLQYQHEETGAARLLFDPLDPELAQAGKLRAQFKAHRSMRDVEPSVNLWLSTMDETEPESQT